MNASSLVVSVRVLLLALLCLAAPLFVFAQEEGNFEISSITETIQAEVVEIQAETCELLVEGDDETYSLYQGVDVAANEELSLSCTLINHGKSARTVVPQYETFERTTFGEQIQTSYPSPDSITIASGAKKEVMILIPKATAPQAYDVVVTLVDESSKTVASNKLIAHYVLSGASATIQTVDFSKNQYALGEEMPVASEPVPEPARSNTSPLMLVTIIALATAFGTIILALSLKKK